MRRHFKIVVAYLATAVWVGACADIFGINGGVLEDGSVGDSSSDAGPDVPFDGGYVNPDANYADCGSGARAVALDGGVFVSQYGQGSACSLIAPCPSITAALAVAKPGDTIYVAPGTYTETLEIGSTTAAKAIEGGWTITDAGWVPQCNDTTAIIQRDPSVPTEWTIHFDTAPAFTLRLVKIINDVPSGAEAGTSIYGVLSNDTPLTLDNVSIAIGDGVPGDNGGPGFGQGGSNCSGPGDGMGGAVGGSGAPGALTATATGWVSSAQATRGSNGDAGDNGTVGGPGGSCLDCVTCELQCDGGLGCSVASTGMQCPTGGTGGCGGGGGFPGFGAGGGEITTTNGNGGSSVALYVWGSSVTFANVVTLSAGNGGQGGNGGPGADGGSGSSGNAGMGAECATSATCYLSTCPGSVLACAMGSTYTVSTLDGGSPGGPGGPGGAGGQGGGGAGAFSYGYFTGFNATISGVPVFQYGMAGQGGLPNGPNGLSSQHN